MRHKAHVARLEQIMRLLDNEARTTPCILLLSSGVKPSIVPYPLCMLVRLLDIEIAPAPPPYPDRLV